jgi:hypothetical protein
MLAVHATRVAILWSRPVVAMTVSDKADRLVAVQVLQSGFEMDMEVAPVVVIVHLMFHIHVDTTERVHQLLGSVYAEDYIIVRLHAQHACDRRLRALRAAARVCRVDLVAVIGACDRHIGISGD